jgi:hypothetical protein
VYFEPAAFRQFYSGYSSSPGGELYPIEGEAFVPVRVCLCGHPTPRASTLDRATCKSFTDSLAKALAFRARCEPEALQQHFGGKYASRKDLAELLEAIKSLQLIVARCETGLMDTGTVTEKNTNTNRTDSGSNAAKGSGPKRKPPKRANPQH